MFKSKWKYEKIRHGRPRSVDDAEFGDVTVSMAVGGIMYNINDYPKSSS